MVFIDVHKTHYTVPSLRFGHSSKFLGSKDCKESQNMANESLKSAEHKFAILRECNLLFYKSLRLFATHSIIPCRCGVGCTKASMTSNLLLRTTTSGELLNTAGVQNNDHSCDSRLNVIVPHSFCSTNIVAGIYL